VMAEIVLDETSESETIIKALLIEEVGRVSLC